MNADTFMQLVRLSSKAAIDQELCDVQVGPECVQCQLKWERLCSTSSKQAFHPAA